MAYGYTRPRHGDLLVNFENLVQGLDTIKLLQVPMEGPAVNTLFLDLDILHKSRQKNKLTELIDIESCKLHIVHGAFKTSINEASNWSFKKNLKGVFNLLHDR